MTFDIYQYALFLRLLFMDYNFSLGKNSVNYFNSNIHYMAIYII